MSKINPGEFVRQVRQEFSKVTWPTKKEAAVTTVMVFIMVFIMSLFFIGIDQVLSWGISFILGLGG
jgi:preprotein translocase subunit SecE